MAIIINSESGTVDTSKLPSGFSYSSKSGAESVSPKNQAWEEIMENLTKDQAELKVKLTQYKENIDTYQQELKRATNRNIEIISIFATVIALIIIDAHIISSVTSFFAAICLIIGLACVLAIFAIIIHYLFNEKPNDKIVNNSWLPFVILLLLLIAGVISEGVNGKFDKLNLQSFRDSTKIAPPPSYLEIRPLENNTH